MSGALAAMLALLALIGVGAYLIGSISSGYIVGKMYRNVDLRRVGSGSTGATNTFRTLGPGAGVLVALFDIAKGAVAVLLAGALMVPAERDLIAMAQAVAAVGVVAGHCWPALLEGRGGRGVATGFGALMFVATPAWATAVLCFVIALAVTRIVSVGSLASVAGAVGGYAAFTALGFMRFEWATLAFFVIGGAIIVWRHRPNIERLMRGAEPRILT